MNHWNVEEVPYWYRPPAAVKRAACRRWWLAALVAAAAMATTFARGEERSIVVSTATSPTPAPAARIINGQPTGKNTAPPPVGMVGCIHLMTDSSPAQYPVSNRGVWRINPYAADGVQVFADWPTYFLKRVDPITAWLEPSDKATVCFHDFERPFGVTGDWWRWWDVADAERSRIMERPWLVDGFAASCQAYTDSGREMIAHLGGIEQGGWADEVRRVNTPTARAEAFRVQYEAYQPLIAAGVRIGLDGASGALKTPGLSDGDKSADVGLCMWLRSLDAPLQIESTAELASPWWKGVPCRAVWPWFKACHIEQPSWAVGRWPKLGTPEFREWYPDMRVSLFGRDFYDAAASFYELQPSGTYARAPVAKLKLVLGRMQVVSRMLIANNVRVLLDAESIEMAIAAGVSVKEFLP